MDFALNDDHLALRDAVQRFCDQEYPQQTRGDAETEEQRQRRWAGLAHMGLLGLTLSAQCGGSEQGPVEVMVVAHELGRALANGAWLASTVMSGSLLSRLAATDRHRQWLSDLASGALQASVALEEPGTRYDWRQMQTRWTRSATDASGASGASGGVLHGHKSMVLQGDSADLILVAAATHQGMALVAVDPASPGVSVKGFQTLDGRRAAQVTLHQVPVAAEQLIGVGEPVEQALEDMLDAANAAQCAEAVGAAEALLVLTAEHLRTRTQFGSALVKFQSLQHRVADRVIGFELMKSMACAAAAALELKDTHHKRRVVSAAKACIAQEGRRLGLEAIQMHGGMGMTDECRVGHYAKRLMQIGLLWGDATWHLQRMSRAS